MIASILGAIPSAMNDVTHILTAVEQGDPHAAEQLLTLVYDELRKLAARRWPRKTGPSFKQPRWFTKVRVSWTAKAQRGTARHFFAAAVESIAASHRSQAISM